MVVGRLLGAALCVLAAGVAHAQAANLETRVEERPSILAGDFITALDAVAGNGTLESEAPGAKFWTDKLKERGIDPAFLKRRLAKARARAVTEGTDVFAKYRKVKVEEVLGGQSFESEAPKVALHAFRIDVVEDYDDTSNDDIYCYYITTHDDIVWGRVTSIYTGLDEGDSVFTTPDDRSLFGPQGEKLKPRNHTLVDFGIVESDAGDIQQLKKISDAIIDLAIVAIAIYDPAAGAAAAQARAEVKNLLHVIIEMDDDDRLVTDTLRFTPETMMSTLAGSTVSEFSKFYERETFWTHFAYRLHFRMMQ